jgi:hypothetical protein
MDTLGRVRQNPRFYASGQKVHWSEPQLMIESEKRATFRNLLESIESSGDNFVYLFCFEGNVFIFQIV